MRYEPSQRLLRLARHLAASRAGLTLDEMAAELEIRTRAGAPCRAPKVAGKTRCRMHGGPAGSGAPKGRRNGKYRHGGFTLDAIAERRRLAALIRDSRDFLSRLHRPHRERTSAARPRTRQ